MISLQEGGSGMYLDLIDKKRVGFQFDRNFTETDPEKGMIANALLSPGVQFWEFMLPWLTRLRKKKTITAFTVQ
jgi:hypothetical protein